jgi:hypothetical protein
MMKRCYSWRSGYSPAEAISAACRARCCLHRKTMAAHGWILPGSNGKSFPAKGGSGRRAYYFSLLTLPAGTLLGHWSF